MSPWSSYPRCFVRPERHLGSAKTSPARSNPFPPRRVPGLCGGHAGCLTVASREFVNFAYRLIDRGGTMATMRTSTVAAEVRERVLRSRERFWRPEDFEGSPEAVA